VGKIGQLRQTEAEQLVGSALDAGINFIDTADVYSEGRSEMLTGQALKNLKVPRENVVVATKAFGETGTAGVNSRGSSRFHIMGSVKESLRRLQLDHIDLYQLHGFDPATPIEETLYALDNLVQQGMCAISACQTGRPGKSPKRWGFPRAWGCRALPPAGLLHHCRARSGA
jgi:aryl-alcohol dehydrogenase-like predicted oxidoreductase